MRKYDDTYQHKGLRNQLVTVLRNKGITDEEVLRAINQIPRHFFLDSAFDKIAYEDRAFPIGEGQTISQPYTVAYQTQLLQLKRNEKILEIGTGSAYQASVLAEMVQGFSPSSGKKIIRRKQEFHFQAKISQPQILLWRWVRRPPTFAPFDKVIITAAAPFIPPKLVAQMKTGGFMVIPVDEGSSQRMLRITRKEDGTYSEEYFDSFSFVPMLTGKNG